MCRDLNIEQGLSPLIHTKINPLVDRFDMRMEDGLQNHNSIFVKT